MLQFWDKIFSWCVCTRGSTHKYFSLSSVKLHKPRMYDDERATLLERETTRDLRYRRHERIFIFNGSSEFARNGHWMDTPSGKRIGRCPSNSLWRIIRVSGRFIEASRASSAGRGSIEPTRTAPKRFPSSFFFDRDKTVNFIADFYLRAVCSTSIGSYFSAPLLAVNYLRWQLIADHNEWPTRTQ